MPTVEPSVEEEITAEILDLINPVVVAFGLLVEIGMDVRGVNNVGDAAWVAAQGWAKRLLNEADDVAPMMGRNLLDAAYRGQRPPAEFWKTKLGQLLVARDAFPHGEVSRYEASCVLGFTRQWGEYAWKRELLTRHVDQASGKQTLGFERASLMRKWRERNKGDIYAVMVKLASADHIELPDNPVGRRTSK